MPKMFDHVIDVKKNKFLVLEPPKATFETEYPSEAFVIQMLNKRRQSSKSTPIIGIK